MDDAAAIAVGRAELGLRDVMAADLDTVPADVLTSLQQLLMEVSDALDEALDRVGMTPDELAAWRVQQEAAQKESDRRIDEQVRRMLANRRRPS
jgi:hypothetical protein